MSDQLTTVNGVFEQRKPHVVVQRLGVPNTRGDWPEVRDRITLWRGFNITSLNESYGHVLALPLPAGVVQALPPVDVLHTVVSNDEGLRQMMAWTDRIVRSVLGFTKTYLRLHEGTALCVPTASFASIIPNLNPHTHVGNAIGLHDYTQQALVIGISRSTASWKLANLMRNSGVTKETLWPVRQLGNLCMLANCRYGYIQTEEALVAMCFSKLPTHENDPADDIPLHVQFMPVPWNTEHVAGGRSVLTTEKALWWLCMLALADRPRGLEPVDQVVPIDTWLPTVLDDSVTVVERHYYSNVDRPLNTVAMASLFNTTVLGKKTNMF